MAFKQFYYFLFIFFFVFADNEAKERRRGRHAGQGKAHTDILQSSYFDEAADLLVLLVDQHFRVLRTVVEFRCLRRRQVRQLYARLGG